MYAISKEVTKKINNEAWYNEEAFKSDAITYIEAVKSGRMIYDVTSVARSGMSRRILIRSVEHSKHSEEYYIRTYRTFLKVLGYRLNDDNTITVSGCGMNMLFATNYNIISQLYNMKFITKEECATLQQKIN